MLSDLAGCAIVLTRERDRDRPLATLLAARGARVTMLPCVHVEPADPAALAGALGPLTERETIVLTSPAGVDAIAMAINLPAVASRVAAIGGATAERLRGRGRKADFVASAPSGADLARELPLPEGDVVLARSDRALADLPQLLRARGARVREVVAYSTRAQARGDVAAARAALLTSRGAAVVASPSAVEALVASVGVDALRDGRVVAIGPTTARAVERLTGARAVVAGRPDPLAVARALAEACAEVTLVARR
jgi:uroporphyrinogen-III synthase